MHAYPKRRVRDASWEIKTVQAVTLRCKKRQGQKERPYTKRFLPANVIPRSPLLLGRLVSLLGRGEDQRTKVNLEEVCEALSCIDLRTARKHLRFATETAGRLAALVGQLAASLEHRPSANVPPWTGVFRTLELVVDRFLMLAQSVFGADISLRLSHLVWQAPGIGCALQPPIGHVSGNPPDHDSG